MAGMELNATLRSSGHIQKNHPGLAPPRLNSMKVINLKSRSHFFTRSLHMFKLVSGQFNSWNLISKRACQKKEKENNFFPAS